MLSIARNQTTHTIYENNITNIVPVPTKKELQAQWHKVNGKLICQWVRV